MAEINAVKVNHIKMKEGENEVQNPVKALEYNIDDIPPLHIAIVYGLQQVLANISGPLAVVYIIHLTLCTKDRDANLLFSQLLSTAIFMMGVASFLQCTFGVRVPIVQGSSATFIAPVVAMMASEKWKCPPLPAPVNMTETTTHMEDLLDEPWKIRLNVISGCLMAASFTQVLLGCTGVMGFIMNYIGPITICPAISLIGLSLFKIATTGAQHQWGIALLTIALIVLFSLILGDIKIPLPTWKRKIGFTIDYFKIFRLYPHIFAIMISWLLCYILTIKDVFPNNPDKLGYFARTDIKINTIYEAEWFFFPYPGRWGTPKFSVGLFVGFVGATLASVVESVGDYYATASASKLPPLPKHAVNRGIAIEGFASIISGLIGATHATTSYSGTIGFIQITGVASRFVWQIMSLMFVLLGIFGKFGAALTIMPDPILGGLTIFGLGMVIPVGLSFLQYCNMNSSRNQLILAISMMLGMMLPFWLQDNPGIIKTGNETIDQLLEILLGTGMFVGGILGFILDNIIPGTKKERGLLDYNRCESIEENDVVTDQTSAYDLPYITPYLKKIKCCHYVPFMPSFIPCSCQCRKPKQKKHIDVQKENYETNNFEHENDFVSYL